MNIAVCDDHDKCRGHLCGIIAEYMHSIEKNDCKIQAYTNGKSLLREYLPEKFDFIFLDVDMPSPDGFDTAEQIRKVDLDTDIIFVTKMSEEIAQGYRYNARAYLSKPVTVQAVSGLMNRLFEERRRKSDIGSFIVKLKGSGAEAELNLSAVIYFESKLHYVTAVTKDDTFIFYGRLSQFDLPGFVRVHQSYLVNMKYIFALVNNQVVLRGDFLKIPVGRKYKESAKVIFNEYRLR
ncbi:MAG: LytTR family DNA-binding domain-containing protein [Defluviitaleaceae bacterium]|nr:LytTR family DNA-binding domain-containing protein [Defluviitaleaceae bacterium]